MKAFAVSPEASIITNAALTAYSIQQSGGPHSLANYAPSIPRLGNTKGAGLAGHPPTSQDLSTLAMQLFSQTELRHI
jgi:hypothetical protein